MEDTNLMTVNKYIPPLPDGKDGTGYNSDTRQSIEPSFIDVMTSVDYDSDNFKFGLDYWSGTMDNKWSDPKYFFQDPLFPTIDIVLDTAWSPLFITDSTATSLNNVGIRSTSYKNSLAKFLQDYGSGANFIYSIRARQKIHDQFLKTLFTLFNTEFNQIDRNKSYYINSVAGLDKLTSRIVDFEKDKITIVLNEDVSMISGYLSQLYNNLSYSYRDQRQMIPANLLRFNMYIKVHDVRNMYFDMPDGTGTTTSFDKSYTIYLLRDCTFDFKKSKNFDDTITIGGFDAGAPTKPATVSIDVFYKSIEIESEFPLIMDSFDAGSTALKINNKDKDVAGYFDASGPSNTWVLAAGLNTVFQNNYKSPDFFDQELLSNSTMNNEADQQDAVLDTATGFFQMPDDSAKKNYKYGVVSSDIGTSKTREDDIKGISQKDLDKNGNEINPKTSQDNRAKVIKNNPPVFNTNAKGDVVTPNDTDNKRVDVISNDPNYLNTNRNGNVVYLDDTLNYIAENINTTGQGDYLYQPSVFDTNWNQSSDGTGHVQTGVALEVWRDSIMGELNFNLAGFLFNLPFNIINTFFGGGGMVETYINTYAPNIPLLNGQTIDVTPPREDNKLNGETISENIPPFVLGDLGTINTTFEAKRTMPVIDLTPNYIAPKSLDGEFLPFALRPRDPLTAVIDTSFGPKPILNVRIDTATKPHLPVSGVIDTTAKLHPSVSGVIDTTARPHPPVSGVIDTTARPHPPVDGVIDTTAKPHPPVSGVIDTTAKPHPPVSGVIDTTAKQHVVNMGSLYTNEYGQRNIDLGLLYVGVTNENILPLIYLYTGVNKYNDLANYYVFNNSITESKPLNNISIDLTSIQKKPFDTVYEYNNNVDIKKALNDVTLYNNNVMKSNNLSIININGKLPLKPEFNQVKLYDNTGVNKTLSELYLTEKQYIVKTPVGRLYSNLEILRTSLDGQVVPVAETLPVVINLGNIVQTVPLSVGEVKLGSLYEPSVIKKTLEPQLLFSPVEKKTLDTLGSIGNEFTGKNVNLLKEVESVRPFNLVAEYDGKPIINTSKLEEVRKEFETAKIEQNTVPVKTFIEQYISEKLMKDRTPLNGDHIDGTEKKEKEGLNNERLR